MLLFQNFFLLKMLKKVIKDGKYADLYNFFISKLTSKQEQYIFIAMHGNVHHFKLLMVVYAISISSPYSNFYSFLCKNLSKRFIWYEVLQWINPNTYAQT